MAECLLALGAPTWTHGEMRGDAFSDVRALTLLDQDGKTVSLPALVLHFIFTLCVSAFGYVMLQFYGSFYAGSRAILSGAAPPGV